MHIKHDYTCFCCFSGKDIIFQIMQIKSKSDKLNIADYVTLTRLLCSIVLFFVEPLGAAFFVVYTVAGVSDVLDGFLARLFKCQSDRGAKLDSVSDLVFYSAMLIRMLPELWKVLPAIMWYLTAVIIVIRLVSYIGVTIRYKRFSSLHTYLNKVSGFTVFLLPYIMKTPYTVHYSAVILAITFIASLEELLIHVVMKEYNPKIKSILLAFKKS